MYDINKVKMYVNVNGEWCELHFTCRAPTDLESIDVAVCVEFNQEVDGIRIYNKDRSGEFIVIRPDNDDVSIMRGGYYKRVSEQGTVTRDVLAWGSTLRNYLQLYMFNGAVCLNVITASGSNSHKVYDILKECIAIIKYDTKEEDTITFNSKSKNMGYIKSVQVNNKEEHSVLVGMFNAIDISPDPNDVWLDVFVEHPVFEYRNGVDDRYKVCKGVDSFLHNVFYHNVP